jgi:hypothetical protein
VVERQVPSITDDNVDTNVGVETDSIRTILDFLARPESLKSIPLNNATVKGSILGTFNVPNDILPVMKRDKIVGFKNFRADVNLQVRVNTNPMVCGRIIVGYFTPNQFNRANSGFLTNGYGMFNSLTSMTACPHVEIDLASGESLGFKIPYISPLSHWDMTQIDPSDEDLKDYPTTMIMFVVAYTDISVPSGAASLQLFVGLDNVDLSFPTFPTRELLGVQNVIAAELISKGMDSSAALQFSKRIPRNTRIEQQGFLSSIIGVAGKIANVVSPLTDGIPIIGGVVSAAGKIAEPAAQIASAFGFSKELVNCEPSPREIIFNRYAQNVDGVDTSRVFALSHCNTLKNDAAELVTGQDEMSFAYMFGRSEYFQSFYWDSQLNPAGASLVKFLVDPMICDQDFGIVPYIGGNIQPPADIIVPTHLAYLSHMHYYWRGSLKYTFKFAKTAFHIGRVRIMWLPGDQDPNYDPQVTYDVNSPEASYFLQQVVDLRDTNEVVFTVPFSSNRPFNTCVGAAFAANTHPDYSSNGTVLVQALTNLSAPSSVAQKIQCVIEISAGDDFELAVFKGNPWFVPVGDESKMRVRYDVDGPINNNTFTEKETYGGINSVIAMNPNVAHVIVDNTVGVSVTNTPLSVAIDTSPLQPLDVTVVNANNINVALAEANATVKVTADPSLPVNLVGTGNVHITDANLNVTAAIPSPVTVQTNSLFPLKIDDGLPLNVYVQNSLPIDVSFDSGSSMNVNVVGQSIVTESTLAIYSSTLKPSGVIGPMSYLYLLPGMTLLQDIDRAEANYHLKSAVAVGTADYNVFTALTGTDPADISLNYTGVPVGGEDFGLSDATLINNKVQMPSEHHGGLLRWFELAATSALIAGVEPVQIEQQSNLTTDATTVAVNVPLTTSKKFDAAAISMGEHNFSVRSLIKIFQLNTTMKYIVKTGSLPGTKTYRWNGMQLYPQSIQPYVSSVGVGTGFSYEQMHNPTMAMHYPDLIDAFSMCFGYWKGSMRVKIANLNAGESSAQITYRPSYSVTGNLPAPPLSIDQNGNATPVLPYTSDRMGSDNSNPSNMWLPETSMHEMFISNDMEARDIQFQVPFYHPIMQQKVASGIQYHGVPFYSSKNVGGDWYMPQNIYKIQYEHSVMGDAYSSRNFNYNYYRAAADDFSFHLLQGIPPMARTRISKSGGASALSISTVNSNLTVKAV